MLPRYSLWGMLSAGYQNANKLLVVTIDHGACRFDYSRPGEAEEPRLNFLIITEPDPNLSLTTIIYKLAEPPIKKSTVGMFLDLQEVSVCDIFSRGASTLLAPSRLLCCWVFSASPSWGR